MSIEARFVVAVGLGFFVACTKPNPEFCKEMPNDPICNPAAIDAAVDGAPDGAPDALMCTTGAFEVCQDPNTSLVCNAAGNAFEPTTCPNGCKTSFGCQICSPNQTTCANNNAQTCDANGNISSDELCTLGCAGATRCKTMVASNGLQMFFAMTTNPQDLSLASDLANQQQFLDVGDSANPAVIHGAGGNTTLPSFFVPAVAGGSPIRVIVVKHLTLGDLLITQAGTPQSEIAIAFLATDDVQITGKVVVTNGELFNVAGCSGGSGQETGDTTHIYQSGNGGGGNATDGAPGGNVPTEAVHGVGGTSIGSDTLEPLHGGCTGGELPSSFVTFAGVGGGAIQITSLTSIHLSGEINVDGVTGGSEASPAGSGVGGGAGGSVLLEAPSLTLDASAKLLARGGGGGATSAAVETVPDDATPPAGGVCGTPSVHCGDGGRGSSVGFLPLPGSDTGTPTGSDTTLFGAGGGGGGLGRLRINSTDGTFTSSNTTIIAGALTMGVVHTQ